MRIEGMDASIRPVSASVSSGQTELGIKNTDEKPVYEGLPEQNYKLSETFIRKAVDKANETMQQHNRSLQFKIHEKTNEVIVKIVDTDTKEIIREIPSEKILDMFANMLELAGLLVDERR